MTGQRNTDEPHSAAQRCVEITTDEHGSIQIAFVPVGPTPLFITTINLHPKKENCHD
jgi:hypothetical protein